MPGYPPPYTHPGHPPASSASTGTGRVVGIVIAIVVTLVLAVCGCACGAGLLLEASTPDPIAGEPYVVPDDGRTTPTAEPPTAGPTAVAPTPTKKPITRPTSGPAPVTVVYEVTGAGEADISYYDAESDLIHVDDVKLPWRTTIRTNGRSRVMVEATWPDIEYQGPLDCTVTVTGTGKPVVDKTRGYWRTTCTAE
ncbi:MULTISPECIES: MmpS family transport accessory protein [unclassified Micromonospora]|uniref:MmpS family transport accessory protein n=1 Tax=unclassified Micromonospora TaxID=2617518 RepID=UPI0033B87BC1